MRHSQFITLVTAPLLFLSTWSTAPISDPPYEAGAYQNDTFRFPATPHTSTEATTATFNANAMIRM
jgi:hypothetical protein